MVDMAVLCGTKIRYSRLLVNLVGGELASGVDEGGDSSGHHCHGMVDLIRSTCGRG
jgi:hypothetical protein